MAAPIPAGWKEVGASAAAPPVPAGWVAVDENTDTSAAAPPNWIDSLGGRLYPFAPPANAGPGDLIRRGLGAALGGGAPIGPFTGTQIADAVTSPEAGRLALETAGGVAATALAPEVAIPAGIARYGPRAVGLIKAGIRAGEAGLGSGAGSLAAESVDPSESPFKRAAVATAFGATGQGVGEAVGAGVRVVKGKVADKLSKIVPKAREIAAEYVDNFLDGASREETGSLVQSALADDATAFREMARAKADQLASRGIGDVDLQPVVAQIDDLLKREPLNDAAKEMRGWVNDVMALGEDGKVPFGLAQHLRSQLIAARGGVGGQGVQIAGQAKGTAKHLSRLVDEQMEAAARAAGDDAVKLYRDFNSFWRTGKGEFNSAMLQRLARATPENVVGILKRASPEAIARLRPRLDKEAWAAVRDYARADLFGSAADATTGLVSGSKVMNQLNRANGPYGPAKLKLLFGADEAERLTNLAKTIKSTESLDGALQLQFRNGSVMIGKAGILSGLGYVAGEKSGIGGPAGAAAGAAIALSPAVTAKFLAQPGVAKWLELGLRAAPGSAVGNRAFTQLAAHAAELEE